VERCLYSWLHISDCHFGHGSAAYGLDQSLVADRLIASVAEALAEDYFPAPQAILITGDIGYSGATLRGDEYLLALEWLERLSGQLSLELRDIFPVLGNHDVARVKQGDHAYRLIDSLRRGSDIDDAFQDVHERTVLASRIDNFRDFVTRLGSPCLGALGDALGWVAAIPCDPGYTVRLVGLNTALLANGPDDLGHLQLGMKQLSDSYRPPPDDSTFVIALTHHPFDWLRDGSNADAWTGQYADLHLFGHLHQPKSGNNREGGRPELVRVGAGAVHSDEGAPPAHGYNFGAIFVDETGAVIIRIWSFKWLGTSFVLDLDAADDKRAGCAEYILRRKLLPHDPEQAAPGAETALDVSAEMLASLGHRRTAYPTDLSISELVAHGAVIEPKTVSLASHSELLGLDNVVQALDAGRSVIVVGEPGSGKTVLTFLVHAALLKQLRPAIRISISDLLEEGELSASAVANAARRRLPSDRSVNLSDRVVLVVDGVDEAIASGSSAGEIASILNWLPTAYPVLVTCRTRDFETHLLGPVGMESYDSVRLLAEWTHADFESYLLRLEASGVIRSAHTLRELTANPQLNDLLKRPLFARMLTMISESEAAVAGPSDVSDLYGAYLRSLARVTDQRLSRVNCAAVGAYRLWQVMSWGIFGMHTFRQDRVPAGVPSEVLVRAESMTLNCARAAAEGVMDFSAAGREPVARYIHYSFFEYLVADYVATTLVERAMRDEQRCWDLFRQDVPREIRRHLTRILQRGDPQIVVRLLVRQFRGLDEDVPELGERRVVANLLAYILGRIETSSEILRGLLRGESDPFVITALYWALSNVGDVRATSEFIELAISDPDVGSLNRGYLLYYWGDKAWGSSPPHRDDDPSADWTKTRARLFELLRGRDYVSREVDTRRALDLFTIMDMFRFHDNALLSEDADVVSDLIRGLGSDSALRTQLLEQLIDLTRTAEP
jgi:hypothetical protein